jgi:hypothetical protein
MKAYFHIAGSLFLGLVIQGANSFGATGASSQPSAQSWDGKPPIHSDALDMRDYSAILKSQAIRDELNLTAAEQKQMDLEKAFMERRIDSAAGDPLYGPDPTVSLLGNVKQLLTWTGMRVRRILTLEQDAKYQSLFDDHRLSPVVISVAVGGGQELASLGWEEYHQIAIQWPHLASDHPTTAPSQTSVQPEPQQQPLDKGDRTLRAMHRLLPAGFTATDIIGNDHGGPFVMADPDQGPVFGFHITLGKWMGNPVVHQMVPIYQQNNPPTGSGVVYARPGYVVNGVMTDCASGLDAVRIQFARWKDGKVMTSDTYMSDWIGNLSGEEQEMLGGNASAVYGICGRHGINIDALGLVVQENGTKP